MSIADDPKQWSWPADVRARLDAQRIAIPAPKAPEPAPAPSAAPAPAQGDLLDPTDELIQYMFGGYP